MKQFANDKLTDLLEMEKQMKYIRASKAPDDPEQ